MSTHDETAADVPVRDTTVPLSILHATRLQPGSVRTVPTVFPFTLNLIFGFVIWDFLGLIWKPERLNCVCCICIHPSCTCWGQICSRMLGAVRTSHGCPGTSWRIGSCTCRRRTCTSKNTPTYKMIKSRSEKQKLPVDAFSLMNIS